MSKGIPSRRGLMPDYLNGADIIIIEKSVNVNALDTSQNHPHPFHEKMSSWKPVPSAKKAGDRWFKKQLTQLVM